MPVMHDHWCKFCGTSFEELVEWDNRTAPCPNCGKAADRYFRSGCANTVPIDAEWIKTMRDVVDKDSHKPHCVEFLKNPTRENYVRWMNGEKLRHVEPGEKLYRPEPLDEKRHAEKVMELRQARERIELQSWV